MTNKEYVEGKFGDAVYRENYGGWCSITKDLIPAMDAAREDEGRRIFSSSEVYQPNYLTHWIKIEGEESLPKFDKEKWILFVNFEGNELPACGIIRSRYNYTRAEIKLFTHYCYITPPTK
jgi:hypothetical protein